MKETEKKVLYIPVDEILPNRFQPRLAFDEKELNDLANSIIKYGIIQPIVVRKMGEKYEIVAGERRYKASVLAGLKKVPAVEIETDDNTSAEIALLENLQRKNLTSIEEAQAFKKLIEKGFTQEDIATKIGLSQASVANKIRLLNLPESVQSALLHNQISERHARSLLSLNNEDLQNSLLKRIISEKLTVKQTDDEIAMLLSNIKVKSESISSVIKEVKQAEENIMEKKEDEMIQSSISNNDVEEFLDLKIPEVINIEEEPEEKLEYSEVNNIVNPFQEEIFNPISNVSNSVPEEKIDLKNNPETTVINPFQEEKAEAPTEEKPEESIAPQKSLKEQLEETSLSDSIRAIEKPEEDEFSPIEKVEPKMVDEDGDEIQEPISVDAEFFNEFGEIQLPRIINKVREFTSNLGKASDYIEVSEVDKSDSYQITIDIIKS